MQRKLTDVMVKELLVPETGNRISYDSEVGGFGVRITSRGVRAFVLTYWINGAQRRYTIGRHPAWRVKQARERAGILKRQVDGGGDPLSERLAARQAPTVAELCDDWLSRPAAKSLRSYSEYERKIKRDINPKLGRKKAADITRRDIEDLHHEMSDRPYQANRILALLSVLFNHAVRDEVRADNPVKGVRRYHEEKRERYLSPEELQRLISVLNESKAATADIIRLLLLTGARRSEASQMRWQDVDLGQGTWTKPSAHTKQRKVHKVPLSPAALEVLRRLRAGAGLEEVYVFPGRTRNGPRRRLNKYWATICKKAKLESVRIHDLRHTHASILASSGLSLPIIGQLLGHTQVSTTARYAHLFDDPLRTATGRVGAVYEALADGKTPAEVVPLRSA